MEWRQLNYTHCQDSFLKTGEEIMFFFGSYLSNKPWLQTKKLQKQVKNLTIQHWKLMLLCQQNIKYLIIVSLLRKQSSYRFEV